MRVWAGSNAQLLNCDSLDYLFAELQKRLESGLILYRRAWMHERGQIGEVVYPRKNMGYMSGSKKVRSCIRGRVWDT
jgi:hypothetical protein